MYEQCKTCLNLDTDRYGFVCMVLYPKIENGICHSYEEEKKNGKENQK